MTSIPRPVLPASDYSSQERDNLPLRNGGASSSDQLSNLWLKIPIRREPAWQRWIFNLLALLVTAGFFMLVRAYFAPGPGNPGIDENAYLVGGKNVAAHFTPGMKPASDFGYVGPMWIRTEQGWYYPKYPMGVPWLDAVAIWAGKGNNEAAFWVSPVCATLAVFGMYLLTRGVAGPFFGLLGAIALATNPTMLHLALIPSSHAPDICFAMWGMVALLYWWKTGWTWSGIAAGLLLGFTVSIRYSEGLLVLPLALAAILTVRWTNWRSYIRAAVPVIAWYVPVLTLVIFNSVATGHITGYDSTNESTGFSMADFRNKWEYTISQLHLYGLFFLLPLGVLGMAMMFGRRWWRVGLFMVLWFVPSLVLYTAYYWGVQAPGVGYLRFFLALYPPVIASGLWVISAAGRGMAARGTTTTNRVEGGAVSPEVHQTSWATAIGATVFMGIIAAVGVYVSLPDMRREFVSNAQLAYTTQEFFKAVPKARQRAGEPTPILFCEEGGMFSRLLMHMQFVGDGEWYSNKAFLKGTRGLGWMGGGGGGGPGRGGNDPNDPDPVPTLFDPVRRAFLQKIDQTMSTADLAAAETKLLGEALDAGRPIYALLSPTSSREFQKRLATQGFRCDVITKWTEPTFNPPTNPQDANGPGGPGAGPPGPPPGGNNWGGGGGGGGGGGQGRRGGGGGGRGMFDRSSSGLAMPTMRFRIDGGAQTLEVLKITRGQLPTMQPSTTAPTELLTATTNPSALTTAPTTVPATQTTTSPTK